MLPCMPLEVLNFSKFVRTYGTCMHHDKSLYYTCIVPPLMDFLLGYVTLIHYDVVSQELHHVFLWQKLWGRSPQCQRTFYKIKGLQDTYKGN